MNLKFQLTIAFGITVLTLIGFSCMAFLVRANQIIQFDRKIISFVQGFESPRLTTVMKFFTTIGSTNSVVVLSLLVVFFLYKVVKHKLELILFIAVIGGTPVLNHLLKQFFQRARPDLHRLIEIGGFSFPSGHAMNALTVYGMISFLLWRHIPTQWGRSLLIVFSTMMIMMIGTSRIYLGVHYPSDIIAGYFAGGCWIAISIDFFQRYQDHIHRGKQAREKVA
jgi:undecaprenyl-diphosphatase